MNRYFRFLFCLGILCGATHCVRAYDIVGDFSTNNNPNGLWSYGWETNEGGAFQFLTDPSTGPGDVAGWDNGGATVYYCVVDKDFSTNSIQNGTVLYYPDTLHMDPQSYAVMVRFIAPAAGTYNVAGFFRLQDTGTAPHDLSVVLNSNLTAYYVYTSDGQTGQQYPFQFPCSLAQGETVDFVVAANGGWTFLGTGLEATINLSTNAPPTGTYSAAGDFNPNANPNGAWSYVCWSNSDMSGAASLLTTNSYPVEGMSNIVGWWNGGDEYALTSALIVGDETGGPYSDSQHPNVIFYPDTLLQDPESYAVATRFTAPANGLYAISGFFRVEDEELQNSGHAALIAVITNGNPASPIFSTNTGGGTFGAQYPFSFTNFLLAGTTVDFAVADQSGGSYLSTGMNAIVTPLSPLLESPAVSGGALSFSFQTVSNWSYTIQETTNLASTNWVAYSNFTANGASVRLGIPVTNNIPARFFRVVSP